MQDRQPHVHQDDERAAADASADPAQIVSRRRTIPVGDARTIVVRPRIAGAYKAMIWFSFALNIALLLALLAGGLAGLRLYRRTTAQLAALGAAVDRSAPAAQRIEQMRRDPAVAVESARYNLGELLSSIEGLQNAHIRATVPVNHQLPLNLEVPIKQETAVRLTRPVPLVARAQFTLPGGGGFINGTVSLQLPAGMELPVRLDTTVPLSQTVPIQFDVPVDIATRDTELADDFDRLHRLVEPAAELLKAR